MQNYPFESYESAGVLVPGLVNGAYEASQDLETP